VRTSGRCAAGPARDADASERERARKTEEGRLTLREERGEENPPEKASLDAWKTDGERSAAGGGGGGGGGRVSLFISPGPPALHPLADSEKNPRSRFVTSVKWNLGKIIQRLNFFLL